MTIYKSLLEELHSVQPPVRFAHAAPSVSIVGRKKGAPGTSQAGRSTRVSANVSVQSSWIIANDNVLIVPGSGRQITVRSGNCNVQTVTIDGRVVYELRQSQPPKPTTKAPIIKSQGGWLRAILCLGQAKPKQRQ